MVEGLGIEGGSILLLCMAGVGVDEFLRLVLRRRRRHLGGDAREPSCGCGKESWSWERQSIQKNRTEVTSTFLQRPELQPTRLQPTAPSH
jgi:hypothetical protein